MESRHPEPVPAASQLAVLPFLAAVDGFLRETGDVPRLRMTVHRAMSREGDGYLQQVCAYIHGQKFDWQDGVGRTFLVDERIIGRAFSDRRIWRTRHYNKRSELEADLVRDMEVTGDNRKVEDVGLSYLALPFLGADDQAVLVLYADCHELNFFADDKRIGHIVAMCGGFARLFDSLQTKPFPNLLNFPLDRGNLVTGAQQQYPRVQEPLTSIQCPRFREIRSFNYEASAA
ncbi:MAG: hypothetical protein ACFCUT_03645 [Kiloniellaceae bacterium]